MSRGSRLDIVEANPRFAARLRHLVATHPGLAGRPGRVDVHQVERIMTRSLELLHPGGTLTYFAYLGTRRARALTASRAEARRHAAVDEVMAAYQRAYATGRWTVWANLPPRPRLAPAAPPRPRRPHRDAARGGAAVNALTGILGHLPPASHTARAGSSATGCGAAPFPVACRTPPGAGPRR
ncbi:hypothetical protein ABZ568_06880 [Streptomyces olindensis]|uniref:Methyltransferase n=1 Tax=Streptomyces olindensis TaxID=358823 RepID=A0ABV2XQQ2_9ACTN